jgi:hypothetical protein
VGTKNGVNSQNLDQDTGKPAPWSRFWLFFNIPLASSRVRAGTSPALV